MSVLLDHSQEHSKKDQAILWFSQHWVLVVNTVVGIFVMLPFLAPILMSVGWIIPAKGIYWVFSFLCHQLPERSYFLFGPKISYSLQEIQAAWRNTNDIAVLRQFVGNSQMGWKVAWSDRMVSMNTGFWAFGFIWSIFRKKVKQLPWWGVFLLILPMAVDGTTHLISDFAGIGQGFRDSNAWLSIITKNSLSSSFYSGDAWGSFNAWMRLVSGVLFGLSMVWLGFPILAEYFRGIDRAIFNKYQYRQLLRAQKEHLLNLLTASDIEKTINDMTDNRNGEYINP